MSATPRTDAHCSEGAWERTSDLAEFAGRLEIELYEWHRIAGEQIERLTRERDAFAERWRKTDEEVERLKALLREIVPPNAPVPIYLSNEMMLEVRTALGEE